MVLVLLFNDEGILFLEGFSSQWLKHLKAF